jgi:ADP-ribose pyrophosphatase YjhB (NUDIX family)
MTRFETRNGHFSCRAAAVLLHQGSILLQGEPQATMWTLPGGGIELLEPSDKALKREMLQKRQRVAFPRAEDSGLISDSSKCQPKATWGRTA